MRRPAKVRQLVQLNLRCASLRLQGDAALAGLEQLENAGAAQESLEAKMEEYMSLSEQYREAAAQARELSHALEQQFDADHWARRAARRAAREDGEAEISMAEERERALEAELAGFQAEGEQLLSSGRLGMDEYLIGFSTSIGETRESVLEALEAEGCAVGQDADKAEAVDQLMAIGDKVFAQQAALEQLKDQLKRDRKRLDHSHPHACGMNRRGHQRFPLIQQSEAGSRSERRVRFVGLSSLEVELEDEFASIEDMLEDGGSGSDGSEGENRILDVEVALDAKDSDSDDNRILDIDVALDDNGSDSDENRILDVDVALDGGDSDSEAEAEAGPSESEDQIELAFAKIDANGDGLISKSELVQALRADDQLCEMMGLRPDDLAELDLLLLFKRADTDDDQSVSRIEWQQLFDRLGPPAQTGRSGGQHASLRCRAPTADNRVLDVDVSLHEKVEDCEYVPSAPGRRLYTSGMSGPGAIRGRAGGEEVTRDACKYGWLKKHLGSRGVDKQRLDKCYDIGSLQQLAKAEGLLVQEGEDRADLHRTVQDQLRQVVASKQQAQQPGAELSVGELWKIFDKDGCGRISRDEFHQAVTSSEQAQAILGIASPSSELLRQLFQAIDTDRSGDLTRDEFEDFFLRYSPTVAEAEDQRRKLQLANAKKAAVTFWTSMRESSNLRDSANLRDSFRQG